MGLFSKKSSPASVKATSPKEVKDAILKLNRPTAPYQIISGKKEGVDLIAEWKIVDAKWYQIFAKAGMKKVFKIYMKLDADKHHVRTVDREYTLKWVAGIPSLSFSVTAFRGQQSSVEFGTAYAFTEEFKPGQVYKYRFSTGEIKKPIKEAVKQCGWKYKGVAFGKL